ncbi:hypothetical protein CP10139811_0312 [Chlamydia ibidis]|uniref:Uncharacterized protein n=2 Tax=Chlamydia ibidis TaxID=1405396 RepID=S7J1V9_9CHLA|nr:hypothetical protein [Chlamydia ibidis]EPP34394.1 hypothetical protein CP10139811_0312 [Chlamydia ibidis]EQM63117.1 putative inner membrane protein [Chlamydia ibidis 10-1398/6]
MLAFFYKHQKKFIGFVIAGVCVSGIGIGWGRHPGENTNKVSRKIFLKTPSGKKYTEGEFLAFKRFFVNEAYPFTGDALAWNFLNEGLLTERFLTNKIGEKLFLTTYSQGYPSFSKEKTYQPYRRFDAPFISSEEVWKSSAPRLHDALTAFQAVRDPVSSEGFIARVQLFLEEKKFPHYVLRQMLEYRRQMFNLPQDRSLIEGKDLRLFGYRNVSDWFGEPYVSAAVLAVLRFIDEQKKHVPLPSLQEAKLDFQDKAQQAFNKLRKTKDHNLTFDQFINSYFQFLGVGEFEFYKIYREILLCKRAFLQLEGGVTFDYHPLQEFFTRGKDSTMLELVKLPREYHFKKKDDLESFETYLSLVGVEFKDPLDVPRSCLPLEKVKAREPRLVGRRFLVTYRCIKLSDLESKVPMVAVHKWQQIPENFQLLLEEFPEIETCSSVKDLQNLKLSLLDKIYSFSRKEILRSNEAKIREILSQSPAQSQEIFLSKGKESVLEGIVDGSTLSSLLLENEVIECYSQDHEHYYAFIVDKCFSNEEIIPYREVIRRGIAKDLLASHRNPARIECVLSALKTQYPNEEVPSIYRRRLCKLMQEHQSGNYQTGSLPWIPEKTVKRFSRCDNDSPQPYEILESMGEGALSEVLFNSEEGPFYYKCLSHETYNLPATVEKLFLAKAHLNEEILGNYIERFIDEGRE